MFAELVKPLLFVSFVSLLGRAHAQTGPDTNIRPGLWEVTTTSELLKLVPHLSPEQMQGLRDMAKQHGLEMPEFRQGVAVAKMCITPEMAKRNILPMLDQQYRGCKTANANWFNNYYSVDLVCDSKEIRGKGLTTGSFTTNQAFTGKSTFDGVIENMPVTQQADVRGQWIANSCNGMSE